MTQKTSSEIHDNTFILDWDGTLAVHRTQEELESWVNRHKDKSYLHEKLTPNTKQWFDENLCDTDMVIIMTARPEWLREHTEKAAKHLGLRFDLIVFGANSGPRILVNDTKPKDKTDLGYDMDTAIAVNLSRNEGFQNVKHCYA